MKKKVNKKEAKYQKEFKDLVLGKGARKKKGAWDVMYGGAEEEKKKRGQKGNFWVDTKDWFK
jgi:hypothetical protein